MPSSKQVLRQHEVINLELLPDSFTNHRLNRKVRLHTGRARKAGFLLEYFSCIPPGKKHFPTCFTAFLLPPGSPPWQMNGDHKRSSGMPCPELVSPFCRGEDPPLSISPASPAAPPTQRRACPPLPPWLPSAL